MKKLILLALVATFLLSGCMQFETQVTDTANNTTCSAKYTSFAQSKKTAVSSACGSKLKAEESNSDQLTNALTSALIKGLNVAP
jgi:PBP1b-binding outer membrane lipoprotein LpoB